MIARIRKTLTPTWRAACEMIYGASGYEWALAARRQRAQTEHLFMLITFGDLVGLPILPPYYTLRLLPFVVPVVQSWKRSLLRERDWTDLGDLIQGVS